MDKPKKNPQKTLVLSLLFQTEGSVCSDALVEGEGGLYFYSRSMSTLVCNNTAGLRIEQHLTFTLTAIFIFFSFRTIFRGFF